MQWAEHGGQTFPHLSRHTSPHRGVRGHHAKLRAHASSSPEVWQAPPGGELGAVHSLSSVPSWNPAFADRVGDSLERKRLQEAPGTFKKQQPKRLPHQMGKSNLVRGRELIEKSHSMPDVGGLPRPRTSVTGQGRLVLPPPSFAADRRPKTSGPALLEEMVKAQGMGHRFARAKLPAETENFLGWENSSPALMQGGDDGVVVDDDGGGAGEEWAGDSVFLTEAEVESRSRAPPLDEEMMRDLLGAGQVELAAGGAANAARARRTSKAARTPFPSRKPGVGRGDLVMLARALDELLAYVRAPRDPSPAPSLRLPSEAEDEADEAQLVHRWKEYDALSLVEPELKVWQTAFLEISRQVTEHCAERGDLLDRAWMRKGEILASALHAVDRVKREMLEQVALRRRERADRRRLWEALEGERAEARLQAERERELESEVQRLQHRVLTLELQVDKMGASARRESDLAHQAEEAEHALEAFGGGGLRSPDGAAAETLRRQRDLEDRVGGFQAIMRDDVGAATRDAMRLVRDVRDAQRDLRKELEQTQEFCFGKLDSLRDLADDVRGTAGLDGGEDNEADSLEDEEEREVRASRRGRARGRAGPRGRSSDRTPRTPLAPSSEEFELESYDTGAITRIQARARGKMARKKVEEERRSLSAAASQMDDYEHAQIAKIQARARGRAARKEVEERRRQRQAAGGGGFDVTMLAQDSMGRAEFDPSEIDLESYDTSAITKIQARARGKKARREVDAHRSLSAAASQMDDYEHAQIAKIQARARGRAARKEVEERRRQRQAAGGGGGFDVTMLAQDSMGRAEFDPSEIDLESYDTSAITKIQARARGKKARREVDAHRSLSAAASQMDDYEHAQIAKIQARARGRAARKEVEERRRQRQAAGGGGGFDVTMLAQDSMGRAEFDPSEIDLESYDTSAITKIQARARGKKARREVDAHRSLSAAASQMDDYEHAQIAKIQARARGRAARKEVEERRRQAAASGGVRFGGDNDDDEEELPDLATFDEGAITKIQARARGKAARKQVNLRRKTVSFGGDDDDEEELPDLATFDEGAITKIQARARGKAARKQVNLRRKTVSFGGDDDEDEVKRVGFAGDEEELPDLATFDEGAITKIQARARGKAARKHVAEQRKTVSFGGDDDDEEELPDLATFDEGAITKIQARARGKAARKQVNLRRKTVSFGGDDDEDEVKRVGFAGDEEELPDLATFDEGAITKIQARARGKAARKQVAEQRKTVSFGGDDDDEEELPDLATFDEGAITKIQARARGKAARKQVNLRRKTVSFGGDDDEDEVNRVGFAGDEEELPDLDSYDHDQITKIQARARGKAARKQVNLRRKTVSFGGDDDDEEELPDLATFDEGAITKIQARARGKAARKQVNLRRKTVSFGGDDDDEEELPDLATFDEGAITKIQARARGKAARKQVNLRRKTVSFGGDDDDEDEVKRVGFAGDEEELPDLDSYDHDQITKIQARARGKAARKQVNLRRKTVSFGGDDDDEERDGGGRSTGRGDPDAIDSW